MTGGLCHSLVLILDQGKAESERVSIGRSSVLRARDTDGPLALRAPTSPVLSVFTILIMSRQVA